MKNVFILLLMIIGSTLLLTRCENAAKHSANEHMHHKANHEELIKQFDSPNRAKWQRPDAVISSLGDLSGKTVADIGAGSGYFTFPLAKNAAKVIAVDIDEKFIDHIEKKIEALDADNLGIIETRLAVENDPYLKLNEVDIVLIVNTYHHIQNRIKYFRSLQKNLKPDGQLVIVDYKKKRTPMGPPSHIRLSSKQVVNELTEAGYTGIKVDETTLPYQYIIKTN